MALAQVLSRAQNGLDADLVTVEVLLVPGLPGLNIVGLPKPAVRESKDRVKAALATCGYCFPKWRMTCNLAPADLPKEGGRFDLAIALGILAASQQVPPTALQDLEVLGELSLSGEIRPVRGVLPAALNAARAGHRILVPQANADEAALAGGVRVIGARHLAELCAALHAEGGTRGGGAGHALTEHPQATGPPQGGKSGLATHAAASLSDRTPLPDLGEVRGQRQARRALEIAAAGAHSLLLIGPPGAGKSMLAARLPGLLPPMSRDESTEVAAIASISHGGFDPRRWGLRPYRAPHHTASGAALVGGGSVPRPGEITLAHHGVLFLDELCTRNF